MNGKERLNVGMVTIFGDVESQRALSGSGLKKVGNGAEVPKTDFSWI